MDSQKKYKPAKLYYQLYEPNLHHSELCPIIFLHGTATSHSTWKGVYTKIGDKTNRKVYIVDLRNHGQSEWSEHNTLHDHEADLENFLSENGIPKCILIGHSLGGKIAMFFAMMKPELVEKIVTEEVALSNPSVDDMREATEIIMSARKINMLPKGMDEVDIRNLLSRIISEKYPSQNDFAFCTPLRKNCDGSYQFDFNFDVIEKTFQDRSAFDIDFNKCQKFTGPILVMYAEVSVMKVKEDKKIKEFFPDAEFCKFETDAHVLHVERSDEFVRKVSSFINK